MGGWLFPRHRTARTSQHVNSAVAVAEVKRARGQLILSYFGSDGINMFSIIATGYYEWSHLQGVRRSAFHDQHNYLPYILKDGPQYGGCTYGWTSSSKELLGACFVYPTVWLQAQPLDFQFYLCLEGCCSPLCESDPGSDWWAETTHQPAVGSWFILPMILVEAGDKGMCLCVEFPWSVVSSGLCICLRHV